MSSTAIKCSSYSVREWLCSAKANIEEVRDKYEHRMTDFQYVLDVLNVVDSMSKESFDEFITLDMETWRLIDKFRKKS